MCSSHLFGWRKVDESFVRVMEQRMFRGKASRTVQVGLRIAGDKGTRVGFSAFPGCRSFARRAGGSSRRPRCILSVVLPIPCQCLCVDDVPVLRSRDTKCNIRGKPLLPSPRIY